MFEPLTSWNFQILDPDRIPVVLSALLLTAVVGMVTGPMHGNANPFLWKVVNSVLGPLGLRLDRVQKRGAADLMFRGFALTVLGLGFFYLLAMAGGWVARAYPLYGVTEIFLLSLCFTSGAVWYALLRLYFAQKENKVGKGAFFAIAQSTRTDLNSTDDFGITRTGMGLAARAFDKGLVAPALWYLIAGLPGAYIYALLAALAWRFGKDGFTKGFGGVPLALEKLMGFVPTMFAGMLIALAGLFTPTGGMTRALIGQMAGKARAPYEQGGMPLTAMAYALNVSLGGPAADLEGSAVPRVWTGPAGATARLENGHLRRAVYINLMAHLLFVAGLLGAMLWGGL